jgi:hypothetical protein
VVIKKLKMSVHGRRFSNLSVQNGLRKPGNEYTTAYIEYGQVAETHRIMDKFYAPELSFDDMMTNREQWYEACLAHPEIQDKLTIEHLFINKKQTKWVRYLQHRPLREKQGRYYWS